MRPDPVQEVSIECPPWLDDGDIRLYHGDCAEVLAALPANSAQTCVTSPPYWRHRDYGTHGQIGQEATPDLYIANLVDVFREVRRALRMDGTVWVNLGDSYLPNKQLAGIPWRVALALQSDGWVLRSEVVWSKPDAMPESVTDRPTVAHEQLFLLTRQPHYKYDAGSVREPNSRSTIAAFGESAVRRSPGTAPERNDTDPGYRGTKHCGVNPLGRNLRSVWEITTAHFPGAHFATFPEALVRRCILAGSRPGDLVLDPFVGSGTTPLVARKHQRRGVGIDLSAEYLQIAARRLQQLSLLDTSWTESGHRPPANALQEPM